MSMSTLSDREDGFRGTEEPIASEAESSFGDILSQFEQSHAHESGAREKGRETQEVVVVAVNSDSVFCDVGQKTEGILPLAALRDEKGPIEVKPGDKLEVVVGGRDNEGYYQLSVIKVERPKDWSSLQKAFDEKLTISGVVTQVIKGGLAVDVGVRAFMPASRSGARDVPEMQTMVGQEIACRVIKLETDKEDVVVDRRVVLEEERSKAKEALVAGLQAGTTVTGTVRSLLDYGAFIDIGGIDGMLHVADMSHGRVNKPADVLSVGQQITVKILKVDAAKHRISLGLKQLQADPWSAAAEKYHVGERVRGTVVRLTDFGAFVELEPGLDGLIHLSEMSWSKKIRKPADLLKVGESVDVVILGVNQGEKRIALGLKQALGDPWDEVAKKYPVGSTVEGPITQLKQFGAFVQISDDIEGMIHVGDVVNDKRINHPQDVLKVGQVVTALVLENDREKRRLRLGLKQLQPTVLDEFIAAQKEGATITGRVSEVKGNRVTVELGEGVYASYTVAREEKKAEVSAGPVDVSALSSLLANRWKGGPGAPADESAKRELPKPGQVRSFRIVKLDAEKKKIEIEAA